VYRSKGPDKAARNDYAAESEQGGQEEVQAAPRGLTLTTSATREQGIYIYIWTVMTRSKGYNFAINPFTNCKYWYVLLAT
jgi:hypothetical protein